MKRLAAITCAAAAVVMSATAPATAAEPVVSFTFLAEPGAFPVDGREGHWSTPQREVRIWENAQNVLRLDADGTEGGYLHIGIDLAAPGNAPLRVGTYSDVRMRPTAQNPGLLLASRGLVCDPVAGSFTVRRLERDEAGRLTGLDVDVEQHCVDATTPAFHGHLHLES